MEQHLSWIKAYGTSILFHLVMFALLAAGLSQIVAEKEAQTYVVDLASSEFREGSGHEGGGAGADFPEPLKEADVEKRIESVQQEQALAKTAATMQAISSEAPLSFAASAPAANTAEAGTPAAGQSASDAGNGTGEAAGDAHGFGAGEGTGAGDAAGGGEGVGAGSENGAGTGTGETAGTGSSPFDTAGFSAAVDANKEYPYQAITRGLEGTTTLTCTIEPSGSITGVSVAGSSGYGVIDKASVSAARAVGSYPNPTGRTVSVTISVKFYLN